MKIGHSHLLQLNKFCMFRLSFILHPKEFAEQTTDLNETDLKAAWAIIDSSQMVLYNCGVEAGASQGHKHMQILPRPDPGFDMFPDKDISSLSFGELLTSNVMLC